MTATTKSKRKARQRPPWGKVLDGKPIEDFGRKTHFSKKVRDEFLAQALQSQFKKMLEIKKHYGIEGESGWRPWYDLALAIASELDDSLKLIDPIPARTGKTAPFWRGAHGHLLAEEVAALRETHPKEKIIAILARLREMSPKRYGKFPLNYFEKSYYEAMRFVATKQNKT